jgi:hypothetical protein
MARKNSIAASNGQALAELGAFWSEDVTDAAVWTIVGTGNDIVFNWVQYRSIYIYFVY